MKTKDETMNTLPFGWDDERQDLFDKAKRPEGAHCDLCQRYIKVYKRKINSSMARWLIQLVRRFECEPRWYGVGEPWSKHVDSRENAKLIYWGMVEQKPKEADNTSKRTSGLWKPTPRGVAFVHGRYSAPSYKFLYKNEVIFEDGELATIVDALGDDFNYGDLMSEGLLR